MSNFSSGLSARATQAKAAMATTAANSETMTRPMRMRSTLRYLVQVNGDDVDNAGYDQKQKQRQV